MGLGQGHGRQHVGSSSSIITARFAKHSRSRSATARHGCAVGSGVSCARATVAVAPCRRGPAHCAENALCTAQHLDGGFEPRVRVGDRQLHPALRTAAQRAQKLRPKRLGFRRADRQTENLPHPLGVAPHREVRRLRHQDSRTRTNQKFLARKIDAYDVTGEEIMTNESINFGGLRKAE